MAAPIRPLADHIFKQDRQGEGYEESYHQRAQPYSKLNRSIIDETVSRASLVHRLIVLSEMGEIALANLKLKCDTPHLLEALWSIQALLSEGISMPEQGFMQDVDVSLQFSHSLMRMESPDVSCWFHADG